MESSQDSSQINTENTVEIEWKIIFLYVSLVGESQWIYLKFILKIIIKIKFFQKTFVMHDIIHFSVFFLISVYTVRITLLKLNFIIFAFAQGDSESLLVGNEIRLSRSLRKCLQFAFCSLQSGLLKKNRKKLKFFEVFLQSAICSLQSGESVFRGFLPGRASKHSF